MSLRANITNQGNIAVIALEGKLDYENQDVLKDNIEILMQAGKQVVIDMDGLSFVGSSGITQFIQAVYTLKGQRALLTPQFCNVKNEFKKIFRAYDSEKELTIHETREAAVTSFFRTGEGENN